MDSDVYSSSISTASRLTSSSLSATQTSVKGTGGGQDMVNASDMAQRCERGKQALRANLTRLAEDQVRLASSLVGVGQGHLFENWAPPGIHDDDKERLLTQLRSLDTNYPGGLRSYVLNARELLLKSKHKVASLEGYRPEVPEGFSLKPGTQEMVAAERQGYAVMEACALVLLAGGLGERLGYSGIKIALPAEITTGRCYLQYYIDSLLAMQSACDMAPGQLLPLIIMTSADTHVKTQELLLRNGHFGADPSQIILLMQEQVPALADGEAHIAISSEDSSQVMTKPHGHGDVHHLLYTSGTIHRLEEQGYKWLYFFQDTNALAIKPLPATLGLAAQHDLDMISMAVPRRPGDACGALMQLRSLAEGHAIVNNVEYSEVEGFLGGEAEPLDSSGESVYPGNTNQFVVKISTFSKCLQTTKGLVPEFVNPKYADEKRSAFSTPTRLECMMQDLPRLFPPHAKVTFAKMERWISYTPVKNGVKTGAALSERGLPPMTASTGEADLYAANRGLLRLASMHVADAAPMTFLGLTITPGPRVVLAPSFALGVGDVLHKVRGGSMTARSTLIVSGPDVQIDNLELDGTLIVRAVAGATVHLKGLVVKNRGWAIEPLKEGGRRAPEELRVRGYQLVKYEQRVLEFALPGSYVVEA